VIRPYQAGVDDDAIVRIFIEASRLAHSFLGEDAIQSAARDVRAIYLPMAETHVVTDDTGTVLGFIALVGQEVGGFFMDPAHRGKGKGRALMDDAIRRAGVLELDVFTRNAVGRRFYERYGFTPIAEAHDARFDHPVIRMRSPDAR